jgi:hypothetical protein
MSLFFTTDKMATILVRATAMLKKYSMFFSHYLLKKINVVTTCDFYKVQISTNYVILARPRFSANSAAILAKFMFLYLYAYAKYASNKLNLLLNDRCLL